MKKILSILVLALPLSLWAQGTIEVESSSPNLTYTMGEIAKIVLRSDSTFFYTQSNTVAVPSLGTTLKFTGFLVANQSPNEGIQPQWTIQGDQISIASQFPIQYELIGLDGAFIAGSESKVKEWQATLSGSGPFLLRLKSEAHNRTFLIQSVEK